MAPYRNFQIRVIKEKVKKYLGGDLTVEGGIALPLNSYKPSLTYKKLHSIRKQNKTGSALS